MKNSRLVLTLLVAVLCADGETPLSACERCSRSGGCHQCSTQDDGGILNALDTLAGKLQSKLKFKRTSKADGCNCSQGPSCGCEVAPSCGCETEPTCGCEQNPSCGCELAPSCGCEASKGCACQGATTSHPPAMVRTPPVYPPMTRTQPAVPQYPVQTVQPSTEPGRSTPLPLPRRESLPIATPQDKIPDAEINPFQDDTAGNQRRVINRYLETGTAIQHPLATPGASPSAKARLSDVTTMPSPIPPVSVGLRRIPVPTARGTSTEKQEMSLPPQAGHSTRAVVPASASNVSMPAPPHAISGGDTGHLQYPNPLRGR
jgi:hypothetical protein